MSRSLLFILMDNHLERGPYMFRVAQASPPAGFGTVSVQGPNVFPWSGSGTLAELAAGTAALRTPNTHPCPRIPGQTCNSRTRRSALRRQLIIYGIWESTR